MGRKRKILIGIDHSLLDIIDSAARADHKDRSAWIRDACLQQLRQRTLQATSVVSNEKLIEILTGLSRDDRNAIKES